MLSGFGLGTLLMPVVAVFFPIETAIAVTAVVHLANNFFKLMLVGKQADRRVLWRFGLPAVLSSFIGAITLNWLAHLPPLLQGRVAGFELVVMPVNLAVGLLILGFVAIELSQIEASWRFGVRLLPLGGCLSGFFGGLSGNQGALRSMFLLKAGLSKEQFVATGVVLAVIVDLARLPVYGVEFFKSGAKVDIMLVVITTLAAFVGSFLAAHLLQKLTLRFLQVLIATLLIFVALGLIAGLL